MKESTKHCMYPVYPTDNTYDHIDWDAYIN